jgi:outer membrane cobalamin receptor
MHCLLRTFGATLAVLTGFHPSMASAQRQGAANPPTAATSAVSEVTVEGKRAEVETSIDRRSYSVAKDLSVQIGSVADVLRNIPAVQVDAQGNPGLQGESNVTILVDGRPSSQFSGQSLGQALQAMPADQIDRIEVMTNPSAEFQAQGKGGIINLVTSKARGAGSTGSLRVRAGNHRRASVSANLGYNTEKLSVTGDVTYKRTPQSAFDIQNLSQIDPPTGLTGRTLAHQGWVATYLQAHAGGDYDLDSRTRISGSARFSSRSYVTSDTDQFVQNDASGVQVSVLDRTGREHESVDIGEASLTWRRTYDEDHDLTLYAGYRGYEHRYRRLDVANSTPPDLSVPPRQSVDWTDHSPRATLTADDEQPLARGKLKFGLDVEYAPKVTVQDAGKGPTGGPVVLIPSQHGVFRDVESEAEAYVS